MPRSRLPDLIATGGAFLAAGLVPFLIGGAPRWAIAAAVFITAAAAVAAGLSRRRSLISPLGWVLLATAAYVLLQAIPIPFGLLEMIAPATAKVLEVSLAGAGGVPGWHPLSLDPVATLFEAAKMGAIALAFIVAHNRFRRRARQRRLLGMLAAAGLVMTVAGIASAVATPGRALFFYDPDSGPVGGLIATAFVNPNHAAAFLTIATLAAIGLALEPQFDLQRRVLLLFCAGLSGAGVLLTLSRGGMAALAAGLLTLAIFALRRVADDRGVARRLAAVATAGAAVIGLGAWLGYAQIAAEVLPSGPSPSWNKLDLWPGGLALIRDHPWTGIGRGAFLVAFPRYLPAGVPASRTFTHLENEYLHLPAELGIPAGALLLGAIAVATGRWLLLGPRTPFAAAAAAALVAIALHNTVDFNLELLGVALPAAVIAGALSAAVRRQNEEHLEGNGFNPPRRRDRRRVTAATGAALAVLTAGLIVAGPPSADDDARILADLARRRAPYETVVEAARAAIRRHPADYLPHLAAGRIALRDGRPEAIRWLNRALFLAPRSADAHADAARALLRYGHRRQALLELRLALENGAGRSALARAMSLARDAGEALAALPRDPAVAAAGVDLLRQRDPALALAVAERLVRRHPGHIALARAHIDALVAAGKRAKGLAAARRLAETTPSVQTFDLLVRVERVAATPQARVATLREALRRYPANTGFRLALAEALLAAGQRPQALKVTEEITGSGAPPAVRARAHRLAARILTAMGRTARARIERATATRLATEDD